MTNPPSAIVHMSGQTKYEECQRRKSTATQEAKNTNRYSHISIVDLPQGCVKKNNRRPTFAFNFKLMHYRLCWHWKQRRNASGLHSPSTGSMFGMTFAGCASKSLCRMNTNGRTWWTERLRRCGK